MDTIFARPFVAGMFLGHSFKKQKIKAFLFLYELEIVKQFSYGGGGHYKIIYETFIEENSVLQLSLPDSVDISTKDHETASNEIKGILMKDLTTDFEEFLQLYLDKQQNLEDVADDITDVMRKTLMEENAEMLEIMKTVAPADTDMLHILKHCVYFFHDLSIEDSQLIPLMAECGVTEEELKDCRSLWRVEPEAEPPSKVSGSRSAENLLNNNSSIDGSGTMSAPATPAAGRRKLPVNEHGLSEIAEILSHEKNYDSWATRVPKDTYKKTKKDEIKRQELIFELCKTEKNFLAAMVALKEVFQDPLMNGNCIKSEKVSAIFANLDEIVAVSYRMHCKMREKSSREFTISSVVDLFDEEFESYKVFATFCSNQAIAKDEIISERKKNEQFNEFLNEGEKDTRCNRMKLDDMMIMPMQRVTRYLLFLESIQEKSKNIKDKEISIKCVPRVEEVVHYINSRTKRVSNVYELKKLQELIVCENGIKIDLCDSPREFIRQGELIVNSAVSVDDIKKHARNNKNAFSTEGDKDGKKSQDNKQTIIVVNDMVVIGQLHKNKLYVREEPLHFKDVHVTDGAGGGASKSFYLLNKEKQNLTEFVCYSAAEKKAWVNIIMKAVAAATK